MIPDLIVMLPRGLCRDGHWDRLAALRPVTGEDEAFLLDIGSMLAPAQRATALLARCVSRLGRLDLDQLDRQAVVRALSVGDREALLLHLRRITLGERLQCVLTCPECAEALDLDLRVVDLLVLPGGEPEEHYRATLRDDGSAYLVHFRLPTGEDQELAAEMARSEPAAAEDLLLSRCVESLHPLEGGEQELYDGEQLPQAVRRQLPALLAAADPQAELLFQLTCPACDHPFQAFLDAGEYLYQELVQRGRSLYREAHALAVAYGWSESEIMGLTAQRRRRYLEVIDESLSGP